jgi:hypothetical protein
MSDMFKKTMVVLAAISAFAVGSGSILTSLDTGLQARFAAFLMSRQQAIDAAYQSAVNSGGTAQESDVAPEPTSKKK